MKCNAPWTARTYIDDISAFEIYDADGVPIIRVMQGVATDDDIDEVRPLAKALCELPHLIDAMHSAIESLVSDDIDAARTAAEILSAALQAAGEASIITYHQHCTEYTR